ncbi:MAG TPA: L-lactate dehydrogenase, partial [Firmicutes bacterium]|nr:L-lactate dehydrogenase [Bacillota bacterium]
MINTRKVAIIGDGAVGSSIAYTLMLEDFVNEIALIDLNKDKALGDVLDMQDGLSFLKTLKVLKSGSYSLVKDSHVVIITAGVAQKEGETRLDLLKRNASIMASICDGIKPYLNKDSIVIVVSNPCDVLSYLCYKKLGLPSKQVFGSGTVLDTSRLKTLISKDTLIDSRNIHTFVIGEHGDSEV